MHDNLILMSILSSSCPCMHVIRIENTYMVKWLTNFICEVYLLCKWVYTYHENYCGN
jgi:hypothetical protein